MYGHTGDILATKILTSAARVFLQLTDLHTDYHLAKDAHTNCTQEEAETYAMLTTGSKDGKKRDAHERYVCGCGSVVKESYRERHQRTKKHIDYLERLGLKFLVSDKLEGDYSPEKSSNPLIDLLNSQDIYADGPGPEGELKELLDIRSKTDGMAIDDIKPHPDLEGLMSMQGKSDFDFDPSSLDEMNNAKMNNPILSQEDASAADEQTSSLGVRGSDSTHKPNQ